MKPETKKLLEELAKKKAWSDNEDLLVNDYAGGNIDDAYEGGINDGEILLARQILEEEEQQS